MDYDDERIKAIIRRAINIAKEIEEPYRLKAFEIVLSKLWAPFAEQKTKTIETASGESGTANLEARIEEFAAKCALSVDQIENIFDFQEDGPLFTVPLQGSHAEKQVLVSRYLLAAYHEAYGKEWISLNQILAEHGVGSLDNLGANLKKHADIFRQRGRKKASEYKLVDAAERETFHMIHELSTGGT
ncbi:MAG: hypothetical protein ABR962_05040 [Candidatus Bathyarchaeia archaeon]